MIFFVSICITSWFSMTYYWQLCLIDSIHNRQTYIYSMLFLGSQTLFPIKKQIRRPHNVAFCERENLQKYIEWIIQNSWGEKPLFCSSTFSECAEDVICMYVMSRLSKTQTKTTKSLIHLWLWKMLKFFHAFLLAHVYGQGTF